MRFAAHAYAGSGTFASACHRSRSRCGPRRTYVCFDVLRRIMRDHFGYRVTMIMNITDIDDKIIDRANKAGRPFNELAAE